MRRRLIASTLAIALVVVTGLGVPLLLLARHQVWTSARTELRHQAEGVAAGLEDRLDAGAPVDLGAYAKLIHNGRIVVDTANGTRIASGPELSGHLLSASVGVSNHTVTVQSAQSATATKARDVTLLVLTAGALAVALAVGLALAQARRLTGPLARLAGRADALGRGEFSAVPIHSGILEIDAVSRVLDQSGRQLGTMMELHRDFASDAAHQLRTPLTGIGLRLEELARTGDNAAQLEAEQALAQVERLDRVITALLARARDDVADPVAFDLAALIQQEATSWARTLLDKGRVLSVHLDHALPVLARREHLSTVLTCLLDNALHHGAGNVHVAGRITGHLIEIRVRDDGAGVPADIAAIIFTRRVSGNQGTGIGLALSRSLAAAEGGDLRLSAPGSSEFVLTLAARPNVRTPSPSPLPKAPIG